MSHLPCGCKDINANIPGAHATPPCPLAGHLHSAGLPSTTRVWIITLPPAVAALISQSTSGGGAGIETEQEEADLCLSTSFALSQLSTDHTTEAEKLCWPCVLKQSPQGPIPAPPPCLTTPHPMAEKLPCACLQTEPHPVQGPSISLTPEHRQTDHYVCRVQELHPPCLAKRGT